MINGAAMVNEQGVVQNVVISGETSENMEAPVVVEKAKNVEVGEIVEESPIHGVNEKNNQELVAPLVVDFLLLDEGNRVAWEEGVLLWQ